MHSQRTRSLSMVLKSSKTEDTHTFIYTGTVVYGFKKKKNILRLIKRFEKVNMKNSCSLNSPRCTAS